MKKIVCYIKTLFFAIIMLFTGIPASTQNIVGPFAYYPTNQGGAILGQVTINGTPAVAGDIIAAFDPSGDCVGAAPLVINSGIAYTNMVIYGDDGGGHGMMAGELFYLKIYDASAGIIIDYGTGLPGWQNTNFSPMPGYNNINTVYNFATVSLSVLPSSQNVSSLAGTTVFNVTSASSWIVTENASWFTVSPMNGINNATLIVNYEANTTLNSRSAVITITASGGTPFVTVTVIQSACVQTIANAGADVFEVCSPYILQGNTPGAGNTGTWEIITGTGGSLINPANPHAEFIGIPEETYVLRWRIVSPCGTSQDFVIVGFGPPTPAIPGNITGPTTIISGNTFAYSISSVPGATFYEWQYSDTSTITGTGTDISLVTSNSGTLKVRACDDCGCSAWRELLLTVLPPVPQMLLLDNKLVTSGQNLCNEAAQTITVGGNYYIVLPGASSVFVAGQNISFLPGTIVLEGGYMHAYISTNGLYCSALASSIVVEDTFTSQEPENKDPLFVVFPNPTTGTFTIELLKAEEPAKITMSIYGMLGEIILQTELHGKQSYEFDLLGYPRGVYMIRINNGEEIGFQKLIKQ